VRQVILTYRLENVGPADAESEISPWTDVLQTPGVDVPLAHVEMFISHMWRDFRS